MEAHPMRRAVAGFPRTGKTTLGSAWGARSTDDVAGREWSEQSLEVSRWFDEPGPLVIEGMAVPRALRKWLDAHPVGRPVDEVWWLSGPKEKLSEGQERMGKGARTVLDEILPELKRRGVGVRWR